VTVIDLTSDSKNRFKRSTHDGFYKLSPLLELKIVYGEYNSELMPKRLKYKRKEDIMLLASSIRLPNSLKGSIKTSKDESKRYKGYLYYKFTERHLSKHIDNKLRWFKAILKRYNNFTKFSI